MRRNARTITTSPEIVKHIDGLTQANFNLLTKLVEWLVENEKQHKKYRHAVIHQLARVEAAISLILVGQQAQTQSNKPFFYGDKLKEEAKAAEEFIAHQSEQAGLKMIRFICGEEQRPEPRHDRRRGWSGWEI